MLLTVAIIGAAHGLKGEVRLDVRTDDLEGRLAVGTQIECDPPEDGPLTVERLRADSGSVFVRFAEVKNRSEAEAIRGIRLVIETDEDDWDDDPDAFYAHELTGARVQLPDGTEVGTVSGFEPGAAQDLLIIDEGQSSARIPFVRQLVPEVNLESGLVIIDPPAGLIAARPLPEED